ncbi:MAG: hypothetical protein K8L91_01525 [Anaerolineae bacterium]|nr:hypothetical protein [Anaerolineae bacterium]
MTGLFRTGTLFTYKGRQYCVLSSKQIGRGLHVSATCVSTSWDNEWWYGFYFPTAEPLPETNSRATFTSGRQGEGEHHV